MTVKVVTYCAKQYLNTPVTIVIIVHMNKTNIFLAVFILKNRELCFGVIFVSIINVVN